MKKLFCLMIAVLIACSAAAFASAAFDPSAFAGNEGYSADEADGSWMYFRGIVFNETGDAGVQLSLQADGAGKDADASLRLFVIVTEPGTNKVSVYGTPRALRLLLNGEIQADLRLDGKYGNPACASVSLEDEGEAICRILTDVRALSFEIAFEEDDHLLTYELTEENIGVFRRTIGNMCASLLQAGFFSDGSEALTEATPETTVEQTAEPTAEPTVEPTTEPTTEPVVEPTVEPTDEPAVEPTTEPTVEPTAEPTTEPTAEPQAEPTSEQTTEVSSADSSFSRVGIGSAVFMGHYEQDDDTGNGREPIEWRVLSVDLKTRQALLLSVNALDVVSFGEAMNTEEYTRRGLCWENSAVREWLNGSFYREAFSDAEKERITDTAISTLDKAGRHETTDRVFLLSAKEAKQYLKKAEKMACSPTPYTLNRLGADSPSLSPEGYCCWMLRELVKVPARGQRGTYIAGTGNEVGYMNQNHGLKLFNQWVGCPVWRADFCAIRPAMWIRIDPIS